MKCISSFSGALTIVYFRHKLENRKKLTCRNKYHKKILVTNILPYRAPILKNVSAHKDFRGAIKKKIIIIASHNDQVTVNQIVFMSLFP